MVLFFVYIDTTFRTISTMTLIRKKLSEPWFSLMAVGKKTVEGRLFENEWTSIQPGDQVVWYNLEMEPLLHRELKTVVDKVTWYCSFEAMLEHEGLLATMPSIVSLEDALALYSTMYSDADVAKHGVVALEVRVVSL